MHTAPVSPISPFAPLTIATVIDVARNRRVVMPIQADDPVAAPMQRSAAWVAQTMHEVESATHPTAYYGINTGFGDNAGRAILRSVKEAEHLSRNLLLSHNVGVGEHLPEDVVRAALLIRIHSLTQGYSGVRIEVVNALIAMLNRGVYPAVPAQGSLGASGDLAPLAHLVIPISAPLEDESGDLPGATGYCYVAGKLVTGAEAMRAAGITPIRLGAKEGVALINGTAISAAIATLTLYDAQIVIGAAQVGLALTVEAMLGFRDAFLPHNHLHRSAYQAQAAEQVRACIEGSTLVRGDVYIDLSAEEGPPQDPYCIRCAPVVIGAAMRALSHVRNTLVDELNAVTDNPLIYAGDDSTAPDYLPRHTRMISGGNFHGAPLGYVMDYLAVVLADLASISERRIFALTDPRLNRGLPPFLTVDAPGLNSGLMLAQYTAAALVSECKTLAHPASVDSIPSSANREDHVSMSTLAARKAAQIVQHTRTVAALELLCASQALSLRLAEQPDHNPGAGSSRALALIRSLEIAPGQRLHIIRHDAPLSPYIQALVKAISGGAFGEFISPF